MRVAQLRKMVLTAVVVISLLYILHIYSKESNGQWLNLSHKVVGMANGKKESLNTGSLANTEGNSDPSPPKHNIANQPLLKDEMEMIKREDIEFDEKMENLMQMRKKRLDFGCEKAGISREMSGHINSQKYKPTILVSDYFKVMFCFTGDVYSEVWREFLGINGFRSLYSYRTESISYRLNYYYKFLVVQDPLQRIMEAYISALKPHPGHEILNADRHDIYEDMLELSRTIKRDYPSEGEIDDGEMYARFQDFINYVTAKATLQENLEPLWERIHVMCNPCQIKYDYISRAETAVDDSRYIIKNLEKPPKENVLPSYVNERAVESERSDTYKALDSDLIELFSNIYRLDFDFFGYTNPWDKSHKNE